MTAGLAFVVAAVFMINLWWVLALAAIFVSMIIGEEVLMAGAFALSIAGGSTWMIAKLFGIEL